MHIRVGERGEVLQRGELLLGLAAAAIGIVVKGAGVAVVEHPVVPIDGRTRRTDVLERRLGEFAGGQRLEDLLRQADRIEVLGEIGDPIDIRRAQSRIEDEGVVAAANPSGYP